jgi:pimeloyl-ACP methyl ester carboxylesterase
MSDFRRVPVGEVTLRVALQGQGPLVVMVHGFPESWYSWRHQMPAIAAAGFTACAIDVRGYGGSDKPREVEAYSLERLSSDVAGLIAALSPDRPAVVIGHDWGAPVIEDVYTSKGRFFYQHSFAAEGVAEAEFEADVRGGLRRFFYAWSGDAPAEAWPADKRAGDPALLRVPDPDPFPAWLTDADIDYYVG